MQPAVAFQLVFIQQGKSSLFKNAHLLVCTMKNYCTDLDFGRMVNITQNTTQIKKSIISHKLDKDFSHF